MLLLKMFTFLSSLALITLTLSAQPNSIELKDGSGNLLSSHTSIQEAYNAIPAAVTQAYLIELLSAYTAASETYPITLGLKSGTSATNTITIRPAAGATGKIISALSTGTPILLFDDADFIILDGRPGGTGSQPDLTFENTATTNTNSYTLRFLNGATNNVVQYCVIKNSTQNTAGPRAIELGTSAANPSGNSNNLIQYNEIVGGRSGIGFAGTASNPNLNTQILNNKIYNFGYAGIWVLSGSNNILIKENEIFQNLGFNTTNFGIIAAGFTVMDVIKNKIYDIQNTASTSVRGMQITPAAGAVLNIINNFVSLTQDNGTKTSVYGINILGSTENTVNIYYNTVRIGGNHTAGGTAGTIVSGGIVKGSTGATATYNQKNNIVLNNRTGGPAGVVHTGYFSGATANVGTQDIDYNVYFVTDPAANHAGWGGVVFNDITLYKAAAAPNEQNTIFKSVNFVSSTDLHLTGISVGDFDLAGIPVPGITDDIDGDLRNETYPYRGADEGSVPLPVELASFTSSIAGNTVSLTWSTSSEINNYGFDVEKNYSQQGWIKAGFVSGSGTTSEVRTYSFIDDNLASGSYGYRLKQIDLDGTFRYYNLTETIEIGLPSVYSLKQNYPNPFNPSTKIKYNLPVNGIVTIKVFDILGTEVMTLLDEEKAAGSYELEFNASNLPSSVYFYKMQSGNFSEVKKMIILK